MSLKTPKRRSCAKLAAQLGLLLAVGLHSSATAEVVFSESFESPVVSGFQTNTVPDNGNWIGSSGAFNASVRGPYNESVVAPATPPFTTPYGEQGYHLAYSTTMLTTAQGATGVTITAGETYTLTCNAAHLVGASADYIVELVAFEVTDTDSLRENPNSKAGSIVASESGVIAGTDMTQTVTVVFAPDGANAHLGKELAIRFDDGSGDAVYDNVRLIVGHDYAPSPESGEEIAAGGDVTLSWTNKPPVAPATDTYVDILFGTDPDALSVVVDGQLASSTIVNAPTAGTYYWQIISYTDGDPNGTPEPSAIYSFSFDDTDGDGMPDDWEIANFGDATSADPNGDPDSDGLLNLAEYELSTDPNNDDTDSDGLLDGVETATGTWVDANDTGTLPLVADTDDDGLLDGVETNTGTWVSASDTGTDPNDRDYDNDGLADGAETNTGILVNKTDTGTDPFNSDTDSDGAGDYYEVYASFTDPFVDTDVPIVPYPLPDPDGTTGTAGVPVKVYILSGQSNMVGIGNVGPLGTEGTLETITKNENKFPNLLDGSNNWTERNDVYYRGVISAIANGPLTAGQGAGSNKLGPELGFGHIMGYYHGEPVLVLKSSIGNRSLGWDILPQGSTRYDYPNGTDTYTYAGFGDASLKWLSSETPPTWTSGWYAGYEWDRYFRDDSEFAHPHDTAEINVVDILDNWEAEYGGVGKPFEGRDFEIAGFVWWQGDKDRYDMGHATRYEQNLVNLINNLRTYYSSRYAGKVANNAPFVLATLGQTVLGDSSDAAEEAILNAQLAVDGDAGNYPEYENNVKTVYANPLSQGGASNGHYNGNAETYMLVGDALGRAMIELQEADTGPDEIAPIIVSKDPADGDTDVSAGANIVASFNEKIVIGTGNITFYNVTESGTGNVVIDVTDATQVSIDSAGFALTIDPSVNLDDSTEYAVQLDAGSVNDEAGNPFAGISDTTTWTFTTTAPDTTPPSLLSLSPQNGAGNIAPDSDLVATFSEPIKIGSGNITIVDTNDGTGNLTIDVTDATQVTVDGDTLTINPTSDLEDAESFAVQIDATAIDDLVGNSYVGISDTTTWAFTTPLPGVAFTEDFEGGSNDDDATVGTYAQGNAPAAWVRATQGFNASRNGLNNVGAGNNVYSFRYTNSGLTTAEGVVGAFQSGQTITVEFDISADDGNADGTVSDLGGLTVQLVTFTSGTARNDARNGFTGFGLLGELTPAAAAGSYSFQYVDEGADPGLYGQDLAIRIKGATTSSNIDNIAVTIETGDSGETYTTWISGFDVGGQTGEEQDPDSDGNPNATENYFGTDPSSYSQGLVATQVSGTSFEFTHPISDSPATDITAVYKWTTDLNAALLADGAEDGNGTTVTFVPGTPANGEVTVSANITGTVPDQVFVTIDVTQNL